MTTKITYLRDPKLPTRVLTLVSKLVGDQVEYGYSLNRPSRWVGAERTTQFYTEKFFENGDQFSKVRGRQIAEGRLATAPLVADLAGRTPDQAILETLRDASENSLVRRIANARLERH